MTENELDTILNLIPQATSRQIEVISGQVDVHKFLVSEKGFDSIRDKYGNMSDFPFMWNLRKYYSIQSALEGERCKVCDNILQECECKKKGESYEE